MSATVLVVDDDPAIRALLLEVLACEGYKSLGAADAASAVAQVRALRPDLVVTDICMPGTDGLGLAAALHDQGFGDIPVLFTSAAPRPPSVPHTRFVPKPFDLDTFIDAVREVLSPSQPAQYLAPASAMGAPYAA